MGPPMRWPHFYLLFAVCLLLPGVALGDDGETLTELKGILQGSTGNALSSWTSSSFYCTWQGVSCADTTVIKVDLPNQGLSGSIVDVINTVSKLPGLRFLFLNNNQLSGGPIPDSLGDMTSLEGIHLQHNQITGGLPDVFTRLTAITEILISNNPLGGTLPTSLQSLTGLQVLDMSECSVTGTIPSWMGSFTQLRLLYLGTNNFTGSIPPFDGLSSIMELYLNINQLTGPIPASLGGLTTLTKLYIDRLSISGPIPPSLGQLSSLKSLYLDNTQINGTIPEELANLLPTLTALDLRVTKLVGTVPPGLLSNAIVCDGFAPWGWPAGSGPYCIFGGNPSLVCPTGSTCGIPRTPAPTTPAAAPTGLTIPTNGTTPTTANPPSANTSVPTNGTTPTTSNPPLANTSVPTNVTSPSAPVSGPSQNTSVNASSPLPGQNTSVNGPSPLPGQNSSVNASLPVPGQNSSANAPSPQPAQNTTLNATLPLPVQNSSVNAPSPMAGNVSPTPPIAGGNQTYLIPPASAACTCPVNQTAGLGAVPGRCNCVYGLAASFILLDRNLTDWTQAFQTAFLTALANQLQIQPYQIIVERAAQGSILLDTNVVPTVGNTFESADATRVEDVLLGRNGQSLRMNQTQFGRVVVTRVTPPALLSPSTPGSSLPNSAVPPAASSSSGSKTGALIGGILGALAGVLVAAAIVWAIIAVRNRRRRSRKAGLISHVSPAGGPLEDGPSFTTLASKSMSMSATSFPQFSPFNSQPNIPPQIPPLSPGGANAIKTSPWRSSSSPVRSPGGSNAINSSPWKSTPSDREGSTTDSGYRGGHDTMSRTTRLLSLRESAEVLPPWREFTADEIREATGNFDRGNILGSGLFGTVYRAVFADGRVAAVKRAEIAPSVLASRQAEFQRELETLSQLRHRHLVPFLGFCEVASRELMLVYDFMPNGTLQDNLPGGTRGVLDWPARVKVAVEVASAIEYLHNGCRPPIVHRDIKANNILLDENDSAYLGDFGLATLYDAERSHITTAIKGTPGYLDPQYFATQELTQRSDVYSFGVLLLSIVAGKKAIFSVAELDASDPDRARLLRQAIGKVNLTTWAVPLIRSGRVGSIVDVSIPEVERYMHDIEIVAEVAAECVQDRSQDRPGMSEVLVRLRGVLALVQQ